MKQFVIILLFMTAAFFTGMEFAYQNHPYERCTVDKGYTHPKDIGECIWLLNDGQ